MKHNVKEDTDIKVMSNIYMPKEYDFILNLMGNYIIDSDTIEVPEGITNQEAQPISKRELVTTNYVT